MAENQSESIKNLINQVVAQKEFEIRIELENSIRAEMKEDVSKEARLNLLRAVDQMSNWRVDKINFGKIARILRDIDNISIQRPGIDQNAVYAAQTSDATAIYVIARLEKTLQGWRESMKQAYNYV